MLTGTSGHAQDTGAACNMVGPACDFSTPIVNGADGPGATFHENGHPGTTGNPGGNVTADLESPRTLGSSGTTSPINAVTVGGKGGNGSNSDPAGSIIINLDGGWGQPGQTGGNINMTVGSALSGEATYMNGGPRTSGLTLISLGGAGGDAGIASYNVGQGGNGHPGMGGNGGTVTATIDGKWVSDAGAGLFVTSNGGLGGGGSSSDDAKKSDKSPQGVDGCGGSPNDQTCTAGAGNTVDVTVKGTVAGQTFGAFIASIGGDGGTGGDSDDCCDRSGGNGGKAGAGGNVRATLASSGIAIASEAGAAFYVASVGGRGGVGGISNSSGSGGTGGAAGTVTAEIDGNVSTSGAANTYGVLIQSLGGTGGNGGTSAAWFNPTSGSGNSGGSANTVTVTGTGAHIVTRSNNTISDNSSGLIAQSIGGGGGVGPDSNGWLAVGGSGGAASDGKQVSVALTDSFVATFGFNSGAVIAQSIGGGGGKGGDASGSGYIVNLTVGGTGGGGGTAADANAAMLGKSQIQTINKHSPGIEIQSIGGGGGDGGAAYGSVSSVFYGAAISVGGSGGAGGNGGTVNAAHTENNAPDSQIETFDSDSYGIVAQSIGGGGGNGGASTAKSVVKGNGDFPSQSLAMATGGSGGIAGSASNVYLQSSGLVATIGAGSAGLVAQGIGGGGGNAGDASAAASATGGNGGLAVSLAFGGSGGAAGNGGNVEVVNHGLVLTTGGSATGMLVQSIGGGGGNGGAGDAKSESSSSVNEGDNASDNKPSGKNLAFAVGSGGTGGGAGDGYGVTAMNTGAIITLGDSAHGILAQTIGGGGGNAGGGAASTKGDIQFDLRVGGTGGNGGSTYYTGQVNVTNSGTIVTYGADASGILAQSIGGGGGSGGKAGTSLSGGKSDKAGGNGDASGVTTTIGAIEANYTAKGGAAIGDYNYLGDATHGAIGTINGLLANSTFQARVGDDGDPADAVDNTAGSGGKDSDDNNAKSVSIGVGVGGNGGNGGAAGTITVTNQASGAVATMGKDSDAIVAQSIGGGGGKGGNATTASSGDISGAIGVGGNGGNNSNVNANNGGQPTVNNYGTVYTVGAMSSGIVAQSIGGGGGIGGTSSVTVAGSGSDKKVAVTATLGGSSTKANSISEAAAVTSSGPIETRGHDSYGIIAQSISGGGGIVKTLASDLDTANGTTVSGSSSSSQKNFDVKVQLGSNNQLVSGDAGSATVTTTSGGTIVTKGDDGIAILAQAVSGGGGLALGGKPMGSAASDFLGAQNKQGNVGIGVSANVTVGDNITTSGAGGVGVFAQSVGGSGGIAGDIGHTMQLAQIGRASNASQYAGNGTDISVTVNAGATIRTSGGNAPGIIAQSVGGGGGWITNNDNAYIGSAGGTGIGGLVTVNVRGGVDAKGSASAGIFAQSAGGATNGGVGSGSNITISIGDVNNICTDSSKVCAAAVFGGSAFGAIASAVYVRNGGAGNTATNYGVVNTHEPTDGYAFYADNSSLQVLNYGIATGNTNIGGNFINEPGATYVPLSNVALNGGTLTNAGTLDVGGSGIRTVALTGNLVSTGTGRLVVDTDHVAGTGDLLQVSGKATITGVIEVHPSRVANRAVTVLTATGGVTLDPALMSVDASQLFDFTPKVVANTVVIQPQARFAAVAAGLGGNRTAVAGNLQALFDGGTSFDNAFNALLKVNDAAAYSRALNALSGQALGLIGAARFASSHNFIDSIDNGCASFDRRGDADDVESCGWARIAGGSISQNTTVDALGYDGTEAAFQLGLQRQVGDDWYLGAAAAYETSQFNGRDDDGKITGDSVMAGAQLRYHRGALRAAVTVDGAYSWYTTRRLAEAGGVGGTALATPDAWQVGGHLKLAYELPLGRAAYVKPFASFDAVHVRSSAFVETGATPFDLVVRAESETALAGGVGLELGTQVKLAGQATARLFVGGRYDVLNHNDWRSTVSFADVSGGPTFNVLTPAPSRLGRFAVGVDIATSSRVDLSLRYQPEVGQGYVVQAGVARLAFRF
ncbi:autotransporter outer membrane beta-barrel domain-containing protein [Sphingomonas bacterium]|uniref:autotransporter outer membrane beta-barrel domain-containing protein n=1 Tax=Sphingomonas bacterium TaxID=1895847 RepID=UPI001C2DF033|nr:autotransporter outer membrane beta-barrel domain-containing protein [Sphingomonas bacterium]